MSFFGPPDIARLESKQDIRGLVRALENLQTRRAAAEALIRCGPGAVRALMDVFKRNPGEIPVALVGAIKQVIHAIGRPGVPILIEALKDNHPEVRIMAVSFLGESCDPRAIQPVNAMLTDRNALVRQEADHALRKLKH